MNKKKFIDKEGQFFIYQDRNHRNDILEIQCKLIYVDPRPLPEYVNCYLVEFTPPFPQRPLGYYTCKEMLAKQKHSTFWDIRKHAQYDDKKKDVIDSLKFNPECRYYWVSEDKLRFTEVRDLISEINKELNEQV